MIKIMIVDDEKAALDELNYMLSVYEDVDVVNTFTNPMKALEKILVVEVDVVFLDISMPEMDGFMLAEAILKLKSPPYIVFATAYDDYAINAFEINAVDYLLKPVNEDRLNMTVERIRQKINNNNKNQAGVDAFLKSSRVDKRFSRLPLWKNDRIYLIKPEDIIYCTSLGKETTIITKEEKYISTDPLNHFETILAPYNFFRCHRSFLIHIDQVKEVVPWFNNTYAVKLNHCNDSIPISRRKSKEFREIIKI